MRSVKLHMQSDVPYGAFLSGGIDSSIIVSLMQKQSLKNINTFSVGFSQRSHDESKYASAVAKHIGTNHNEIILEPNDAINLLMESSKFFDEPFADNSAIPTYFVAKLARNTVKVCLSGDGGDELFCGYNRSNSTNSWSKKFNLIPRSLRKALATGIKSISQENLNSFFLSSEIIDDVSGVIIKSDFFEIAIFIYFNISLQFLS